MILGGKVMIFTGGYHLGVVMWNKLICVYIHPAMPNNH